MDVRLDKGDVVGGEDATVASTVQVVEVGGRGSSQGSASPRRGHPGCRSRGSRWCTLCSQRFEGPRRLEGRRPTSSPGPVRGLGADSDEPARVPRRIVPQEGGHVRGL
jgi:hypothetical protein